jgi:DNA invertase Pin-like site-specific DNA recombinase
MKRAVVYIRRSAPGASLSYEEQRTAVRALAARHGDTDPIELVDAGKSGADARGAFGGTGRGGRRVAYHELRDRIAAGEVSAVYVYNLSRLARSTRTLLDIAELMAKHGTVLHSVKEGTQDFMSPTGRAMLGLLATIATLEAENASDRKREQVATARARGEYVGRPPFGAVVSKSTKRLVAVAGELPTLTKVADAYRTAGSLEGAARQLTTAKVPTPTGGKTWQPTTVRRILRRQGLIGPPDPAKRGSRLIPVATFARILRCAHCGALLSPSRKPRKDHDWISYRCVEARYDASHPRPLMIAEAAVRAWAEEEAAHLAIPYDTLETVAADDAVRIELEESHSRIVELYVGNSIERPEYDRLVAKVDAKLAALEARMELLEIPAAVDWTLPAARLQPILAALWREVTVDLVARTFEADWLVPEWRQP